MNKIHRSSYITTEVGGFMFALVKQRRQSVPLSERIYRHFTGYSGYGIFPAAVIGMQAVFLEIDADKTMRRRRWEKRVGMSAAALWEMGIERVCFAEDFAFSSDFLHFGFRTIDTMPLFCATAGAAAAQACQERRETAAVFADRMTRGVAKTVETLCGSFRYILIYAGSCAAEELSASLQTSCGVPVMANPPFSRLNGADAAVFFGKPEMRAYLPEKCISVIPWDLPEAGIVHGRYVAGVDYTVTGGVMQTIPLGFSAEPILSAALSAGVLVPEDIGVKGVKVEKI